MMLFRESATQDSRFGHTLTLPFSGALVERTHYGFGYAMPTRRESNEVGSVGMLWQFQFPVC